MPIFEKAKEGIHIQVGKVMEKYHGPLHKAGVTVDVLMASPTTNKNGEASGPPLTKTATPAWR